MVKWIVLCILFISCKTIQPVLIDTSTANNAIKDNEKATIIIEEKIITVTEYIDKVIEITKDTEIIPILNKAKQELVVAEKEITLLKESNAIINKEYQKIVATLGDTIAENTVLKVQVKAKTNTILKLSIAIGIIVVFALIYILLKIKGIIKL